MRDPDGDSIIGSVIGADFVSILDSALVVNPTSNKQIGDY